MISQNIAKQVNSTKFPVENEMWESNIDDDGTEWLITMMYKEFDFQRVMEMDLRSDIIVDITEVKKLQLSGLSQRAKVSDF